MSYDGGLINLRTAFCLVQILFIVAVAQILALPGITEVCRFARAMRILEHAPTVR